MKVKHIKKKILAAFMAMMLCLSMMNPMTSYAANTSYKEWLQSDSAWGSIHLGSSNYTMQSSGCLVTAVAMLACHVGSADPGTFNPGTLLKRLNEVGGFTSGGSFYWKSVEKVVSNFTLVKSKVDISDYTKSQKTATMKEYLNQGYGVIISVMQGGHWVALDRIEGDTVYMMDPGGRGTKLYDVYDVSDIDRLAIYQGKTASGGSSGSTSGSQDKVLGTGTVNCSSLYVRSGAGTNNSIITSVVRDQKVDILGEANDSSGAKWYKIRVDGVVGYVSAQYITTSGNSGSGSETMSDTGVVNCSSLYVRSGAGTDTSIVTSISKGQTVNIKSKTKDSSGNLWYSVTFTKSGANYSGYVFAEYITLNGSGSSGSTSIAAVVNCDLLNVRSGAGTGYSIATTLSRGTSVQITGESKDSEGTLWYQISVNGTKGYVHASYLTKTGGSGTTSGNTTNAAGKTMTIMYDAVNMRSGAGTSKGVVSVLYKGDKVTVSGQDKDSSGSVWYAVKTSSGQNGYVRSDLLTEGSTTDNTDASGLTGTTVKVAYDGVNMRSGAGLSNSVVEVIYMEDTLTVLGEGQDGNGTVWYKVQAVSGNKGYIRSDMIKTSRESAQSEQDDHASVGTVASDWVNVRSGAGIEETVLTVIPEGTTVNIIDTVQDDNGSQWHHISFTYGGSNYNGYISARYVE